MLGDAPHRTGPGRAWLVGLFTALALAGIAAIWLLRTPAPTEPAAAPSPTNTSAPAPAEPPASVEQNDAAPRHEPAGRTSAARSPRADAPAAAAPPPVASPSLHVESDLPGAMVFVDRKYLGTTPLVARDVSPGTHQLNVQVEGREPVVQTIDVNAAGETRISVALAAPRLDARVAVVHKHGMGSCEGTLIASPGRVRYQTTNAKDGFTLSFADLETFSIDYLAKQLRVKARGGRTWNFTTADDNADPLLVFHREVEATRQR